MRLLTLLFVLPLAVACSPALENAAPVGAPTSPTGSGVAPVPSVAPVASPAATPAGARYARLHVGELPGSSTHQWGKRDYDLRQSGGGYQVRLHHAMSFQGSGMTPGGMPPTQNECTAWEPLPEAVASEVKTSGVGAADERTCESAKSACDAIGRWMASTAKPAAPAALAGPEMVAAMGPPINTFGRSLGACGE